MAPFPVLPSFKAEPEEMVEMLYTGGTTGVPKGVPFTNILFLEARLSRGQSVNASFPREKISSFKEVRFSIFLVNR